MTHLLHLAIVLGIAVCLSLNMQYIDATSIDHGEERTIETLETDVTSAEPLKRTPRSKMVFHIVIDLSERNKRKGKKSVRGKKRRKSSNKRKTSSHGNKFHRNHFHVIRNKQIRKSLRKQPSNHKMSSRRRYGNIFHRNHYHVNNKRYSQTVFKYAKRHQSNLHKKDRGKKTSLRYFLRWYAKKKTPSRRQDSKHRRVKALSRSKRPKTSRRHKGRRRKNRKHTSS
ncbi:hypothetical protein QZH41_019465, partial [Actinostola sp. cb2023]